MRHLTVGWDWAIAAAPIVVAAARLTPAVCKNLRLSIQVTFVENAEVVIKESLQK
jgi:hypothetical protein